MSKRPDHATDCPGCDTGWCVDTLLCPMCVAAVGTSTPLLMESWISARGELSLFPGNVSVIAQEAFRRGLVVGTARVCSAQRAAQRDEWLRMRSQRKKSRRTRP